MTELTIRQAEKKDTSIILKFIKELAKYQNLLDEVVASEDVLERWLFELETAKAVIASVSGEDIGFSVYCYNFSTFLGKSGLHIEDLYIRPEHRGNGYGRELLKSLAREAVEKGCGRMEWNCLDWNKPSIEFYLAMGAKPLDEWTTYRLSDETLRAAAE